MISSRDDFEDLLNSLPLNCECSQYEDYIKDGGALSFGTYLRVKKPMDFERRMSEWNKSWDNTIIHNSSLDKTSTELLDEFIDEANGVIANNISEPLTSFGFKLDDGDILELDLPPLNEAEFFSKILWQKLYPDEQREDPYFIQLMTNLFLNIADRGKLHSAIRDWISSKLLDAGKAADTTEADSKAESMLSDYEDYNDILRALGQPVSYTEEESGKENE